MPEQGAELDGFLRREDLIAIAPPDEGGEAYVRPGEVIERFLVVQDVLHGLDVVGRVDAGASFAYPAIRALHGLPEIVLGAQIHIHAIRDVDEAAFAGGEPPVTCLFPVHVVEAHPLRLFGQRGAVLQEQAARLRMEIALALEDEIFRTGFQGDDPHVVHDPGEEEPFPLLGGKAEAFGQPVEKETHSPVVAGQGRMNLVQRVGEGQNQIVKLDAQLHGVPEEEQRWPPARAIGGRLPENMGSAANVNGGYA